MTDVKEYILVSFVDDTVSLDVKCTEKQCVLALIEVSSHLDENSLWVLQDTLNKMWRGKVRSQVSS